MDIASSLHTHFGFDAFRTGQEEAIQSLLNRQHTLAIMPTGAGKSLIYCLANFAIVVASDAEMGGTWAGATETLKNKWVPVFVLEHAKMSEGNKLLLQRGALPFPHPFKEPPVKLPEWMKTKAASLPAEPGQPSLF